MNGIVGAVDISQEMFLGHHGGMHPGLDMVAVVAADGQQLDAVAELPGKFDVNGLDL